MKRRTNFRSPASLTNFLFLSLALLAFAGRVAAHNRAGLERQRTQISERKPIPAGLLLTVKPDTPGSNERRLAMTYSSKVMFWFWVVLGVFIIGQTVLNFARSSRDQRTYFLRKGLAILFGWILLSFGLVIVLTITDSSIRQGVHDQTGTTDKLMAGFWIVAAVIYVLAGIGFGLLVKGRTKWGFEDLVLRKQ